MSHSKRSQLKDLMPLLRENEVRLFIRLYHPNFHETRIDKMSDIECDQFDVYEVIDKMTPNRVRWALIQVENTIANHLKEM